MKTFQGIKSCDTIKAQCAANGWAVNTDRHESAGDDHISFSFRHDGLSAEVFYNTFNGRFFGTTGTGKKFNSNCADLDGEPWFAALLDFVYVSAQQKAA